MTMCNAPCRLIATSWFALSAIAACNVQADDTAKAPDNGTDPTRFSTTAAVHAEHLALNGFDSDIVYFDYIEPLGEAKRYSVRARAPLARNDVLGNGGYDMGDFSLKLTNVFTLTQQYAIVLSGELAFDTASRTELGTGKNVFKATAIYAKFLQGGAIFAPAIVQSNSISGDSNRADINSTTLDFYYVPKMGNPKYFMTYDPALAFDHESDTQFGSLAITLGRSIGSAFGGNSQVFIKPTVFAGGDKPGDGGIELGYKVIGF